MLTEGRPAPVELLILLTVVNALLSLARFRVLRLPWFPTAASPALFLLPPLLLDPASADAMPLLLPLVAVALVPEGSFSLLVVEEFRRFDDNRKYPRNRSFVGLSNANGALQFGSLLSKRQMRI